MSTTLSDTQRYTLYALCITAVICVILAVCAGCVGFTSRSYMPLIIVAAIGFKVVIIGFAGWFWSVYWKNRSSSRTTVVTYYSAPSNGQVTVIPAKSVSVVYAAEETKPSQV